MNETQQQENLETPGSRYRRILEQVKQEAEQQSAARAELFTPAANLPISSPGKATEPLANPAATRPLEAIAPNRPVESTLRTTPPASSLSDTQPVAGRRPAGAPAPGAPASGRPYPAFPSSLAQTQASEIPAGQPAPGRQPNNQLPGVTPASRPAQSGATRPGVAPQTRPGPASPRRVSAPSAKTPAAPVDRKKVGGCLLRLALTGLMVGTILLLAALTYGFYQYYQISRQLPPIGDLDQKAAQFETTRILDRNGDVLYEILDPNAGRRTYVPIEKISPYLVAATIATEDQGFYSHPGVDFWAIGRAFVQNYQAGGVASGASTITQQLARALLFSPEERNEQSYLRKIREAILATEITRRYSKDDILELYLNEIYFGNLAYGIQAAAETYFNTSAEKLTFAQAAFLAGLPQSPSVYDIYTNPEAVYARLEDVLTLMYQASQEQGCIYVSNSPQRVCVDPLMVIEAANEIKATQFEKRAIQMRYPHWVTYIRTLLEEQYDPQTIYRSGFQVYTTLDPELQDAAQAMVKAQVDSMADQNATNGALVAIKPSTGEILALVGSADFYNEEIDGQVNMAISPRQPGSSIKPLTYVAAFEKGWTPSTLLWDVPSEFTPSGLPDDPSPLYEPLNYDGQFHGPVTVRSALANSFNIPAVKALEFVGIYDNPNTPQPDGFINFARRLGITTLTQEGDYGLSLTLGGGDVTLLELTGAYSVFANNGRRVPPVAITKITDFNGNTVFEFQQPQGEQVIRSEHAYLISSILSDEEARRRMFGRNSALRLPFDAAAKTGTTNDYRDNWTMGYTPDLVTGVWVGNADYTPMVKTTGLSGAAPIWSEFMQAAAPWISGGNPTPFSRPGGINDQVICAISGSLPSKWCPEQRSEVFAADQPPLPPEEDLWQKPVIDTWTGLLASDACKEFLDDPLVLNVDDSFARKWIRRDPAGEAWAEEMGFSDPVVFAPDRECRADDPRPTLRFISPRDGDTISEAPLEIWAVADATDWFDSVRLEIGKGDEPLDWQLIEDRDFPARDPELFARLDLFDVEAGIYTLKLTMFSTEDTSVELLIRINIQVPTPTPTPTETPLPTATPTPTSLPTATPLPPTSTPEPTSPSSFPKATDTPPSSTSP